MIDYVIRTKEDLCRAVEDCGFLPLFQNEIPGFSVEEHVAPQAWFTDEEGVWEWKGPVIRETGCAYGKFFGKKAVFVNRKCFPDFANYRRDGYDFDARFEDELVSYRNKRLYDLIEASAPVLSKELKQAGDYRKGGNKGFETIITHLQEQCYVLISDFKYMRDKHRETYGWGVAEYSTPEIWFGPEFRSTVYQRTPEESYERVRKHLAKLLPDASDVQIRKLLK